MKTEEVLIQLNTKMDTVIQSVADVKVENATQTADISHMKEDLTEHKEGVEGNRKRITIVEKQVAFVPQLIKLILTSGVIVTLILGINKIFHWF